MWRQRRRKQRVYPAMRGFLSERSIFGLDSVAHHCNPAHNRHNATFHFLFRDILCSPGTQWQMTVSSFHSCGKWGLPVEEKNPPALPWASLSVPPSVVDSQCFISIGRQVSSLGPSFCLVPQCLSVCLHPQGVQVKSGPGVMDVTDMTLLLKKMRHTTFVKYCW